MEWMFKEPIACSYHWMAEEERKQRCSYYREFIENFRKYMKEPTDRRCVDNGLSTTCYHTPESGVMTVTVCIDQRKGQSFDCKTIRIIFPTSE